ncbi:hypothetical protein SAMN04488518_111186, partial [Pseudovibrio ascidiaceicola]
MSDSVSSIPPSDTPDFGLVETALSTQASPEPTFSDEQENTYVYEYGDGADTIIDVHGDGSEVNELVIGSGYYPEDVQFTR